MRQLVALALVCVLFVPPASASEGATGEGAAREVARAFAANVLGLAADDVHALEYDDPIATIDGREYWTGVFADSRYENQTFVAVDMNTGLPLDATSYQAVAEASIDSEPKLTPPAQAAISESRAKDSPVSLAYIGQPVDYGPAVQRIQAAHPEVEWVDGRPVGDDLKTLGAVSQELIAAKVELLVEARSAFLERVKAEGATVTTVLDLVPMIYLEASPDVAERIAADPYVRQVRAPSTWRPTMSIAHDAITADFTDAAGYIGTDVIVGIVEYARVDYTNPGLTGGVRLTSYRITPSGCLNSPGTFNDTGLINHVSWAAAVAVGRGATNKGIANGARLIDVSAEVDDDSPAADQRILKAIDCAIIQGGAHLVTMSLVQNDPSNFSTSNAYVDGVVWSHHRLVVGNGGNNFGDTGTGANCPGTDERVRSPGSAWNIVTVGGATNDASHMFYRPDDSEPAYCWEDPPGHAGDTNDRVKPELVAPAENIGTGFTEGDGVSAATPMVAGVAAQILEQRPSLLNFPEQMKALLLAASETHHALSPFGNENPGAEGLGTVYAKWSSMIARKDTVADTGDYGGKTFNGVQIGGCWASPPAQTVTFEVPFTTRKLRFLITWMAHTSTPNPTGGSTLDQRFADFNLTIRKGTTVVGSSNRSASNIEWVDFVGSTHGTGTYTATITPVRWGCTVLAEPLAWSYVSFSAP
jgi:hypothetical protein